MNPLEFASALSQPKEHPKYEARFHALALAATAQAIINFISIPIDPHFSYLAEFSRIPLGCFASFLTASISFQPSLSARADRGKCGPGADSEGRMRLVLLTTTAETLR
jgi:hypothetical protein